MDYRDNPRNIMCHHSKWSSFTPPWWSGFTLPLTALVIPDNITLLALPSKSPELNPVENIWQFIRDNWLSNRIFRSYNDIVDHCCFAWNQLVNQSWKIMSIGMREWAHQ